MPADPWRLSDPAFNYQFLRPWEHPPPDKRKRRPRLENGNGASATHNIKFNQQHTPLRRGRQSYAPLVVIRRASRRFRDPRRAR
jgi:hypothetical protein